MSSSRAAVRSAWDNPQQTDEKSADDKSASFKTLAEETTLHGISKAFKSEYSVIRRVFWVLILLAMLAMFLNIFINGILNYLDYPSNTKISVIPQKTLPMPAITVCNNNKILKSYIESLNKTYGAPAEGWFTANVPAMSQNVGLWDDPHVDPKVMEWANTTDAVTFEREGMMKINDAFTYCVFRGQLVPCDEIVEVVYIAAQGFCHQISAKNYPDQVIDKAGDGFGLSFLLRIDQFEYAGYASHTGVGAKVMIHDLDEVAPIDRYYHIAPGTFTHVAFTKTQTTRLGIPWSEEDCREEQNVTNYRYSSKYTQDGCQMECMDKWIHLNCRCDAAGNHALLPNCSIYNVTICRYWAYESVVVNGRTSDTEACDCPRACAETTYNVEMSHMQYPSEFVGQIVENIELEKGTPGIDREWMKENLMHVYIFARTMDLEKVEQQKAYTLTQFAGDLGGQMGLFLGASIITVSEFLEFITVFILAKCTAKKIKPPNNHRVDAQKF